MCQLSIIFTVLCFLFISVLGAPLPIDQSLGKRSFSGRGTWYYDGTGACGDWNSNSDAIVALSAAIYGTGGSCGQWVTVTNTANGNQAYGMIRDECQSCGENDLDMSIGLFQKLGNLNTGVLSIEWDYMPVGWSR